MNRAGVSIRMMLAATIRGLWTPLLPLILLGSILLWSIAYQVKSVYTVDIGGLTDDAYVTGFHAKEQTKPTSTTPELNYRWSQHLSTVDLPGLGNQPAMLSIRVTGYRPEGDAPKLTLTARGQSFEVQTAPVPQTYTFFVDRGDPWQGDFLLTISSPTFTPPGDLRELGVLVDSITVEPAEYGIRPFVIPPVWALLSLLVGVGLAYLCALVTLQRRTISLALLAVLSVVVAGLVLFARPELGLLARGLPGLMLWTLGVGVMGRLFLDLSIPGSHNVHSETARALGSSAAALAFFLRFGGLTYPQFLTSDLLLHVHYVQGVLRGDILITGLLPDGTPVPYPPALYIAAAPLALLFGSTDETLGLLLKWLVSALDAATCLALAWAGVSLATRMAGGLGALVYALSPAPFELMSAGNYSNLFAQAVFNVTMLGGVAYVSRGGQGRMRGRYLVMLATGFFLTALGHYGMMLSALVVMALFIVITAWDGSRKREIRQAVHLIGAFGISMLASVLVFYTHFAKEISDQFAALFQRLTGGKTPGTSPPSPPFSNEEPLYQKFGRKLARLSGIVPLLTGIWGFFMIGRLPAQARNLLIAWLAAAGFFFLLDQALGDAIRWYYLAAAPLSLLAGRFFGLVAARGRGARTLVAFSFVVMLVQLLYIWVGDLIFTRYH